MDDLVEQGVQAFRAGERDKARKFLLDAVKQNPNNERAWGWLSNVMDTDKDRIYCLEQVLRINPNNEKAVQLLRNLNVKRPQTETQQSSQPKQFSQQAPTSVKSAKSNSTKNRRTPLLLAGILSSLALCVCGFLTIGLLFNSSDEIAATVLSAEDVFEVSAIDVVKDAGYTVTSAVCEVVSSDRFQPTINIDGGQIIFHAFRITGPTLSSEVVVLFSSNHTAAQGIGLVHPINDEAVRLFPDFPEGPKLRYPITVNTAGAQTALDCAKQTGAPPTIQLGDIDSEEWRRRAIERFGQEEVYDDGSKEDYVRIALIVCELYQKEGESMIINMGTDYNDSFEKFAIETFCPYIK